MGRRRASEPQGYSANTISEVLGELNVDISRQRIYGYALKNNLYADHRVRCKIRIIPPHNLETLILGMNISVEPGRVIKLLKKRWEENRIKRNAEKAIKRRIRDEDTNDYDEESFPLRDIYEGRAGRR